ncbi:unnamed protein product, partial [marine sediment metagenome]
ISNCYAKGGSVSGRVYVGCLVGENGGTITNCYSTASVKGDLWVGGLVGVNRGTITNCYSTSSVTGYGTERWKGGVGGLVGRNYRGTITNCYATGSVLGVDDVGGLAGFGDGTIGNCYATGNVSGNGNIGGLVGAHNGDTITNCYSSGDVSGDERVGGLVGRNHGTITNCYSIGSVTGTMYVGGLVGRQYEEGTITNCYSVGSVTGRNNVGWLVGALNEGTINNSFWDIETSGGTYSAGGTGKTTAEMQMESTFTDAGWDFVGESVNGTDDIWSICEGVDYPKLAWQFVIGDFDGNDDTEFADFAIFAARWHQTDSSFWCGGGTDLTNDGEVDFDDLKEFAEKGEFRP